jgi:hypothetical protein
MASSLKKNKAKKTTTHEGAVVFEGTPEQILERSVMSCLLWEDSFYEDGESIVQRITKLVPKVKAEKVFQIALKARTQYNLRHVPLLVARVMAKTSSHKHLVADLLAEIIRRPDELAEFLAIYWKDGRCPISNQVKKGLARAFVKFDEYQLAKYNRDKDIKLRDVMFLVHPKAKTPDQEAVFKRLVDGNLKTPDTWEVNLSAKGADKKAVWTNMLKENKLGSMALIRNLRNFEQTGVDTKLVRSALKEARSDKLFPYRFIAAAKHAPRFEPELEQMMFNNLKGAEKLPGKTVLLVDVSGSMHSSLAQKSDMLRTDAANGLAMLTREICEEVAIYAFDGNVHAVPPRRGFALRDALSKWGGWTDLGGAVDYVNRNERDMDRLIVITDEQSHTRVPNPMKNVKGYMLNVASYQNGVGYKTAWTTIDGWSEASVRFIQEIEKTF